ncbi:MAG: branched-chain amino acid ABC transporter permease [Rhodospirillales bacterium]|jgi:branched-chain amino acid transport system permease protein|nr:branched-chain amino acid ABC transporter permease [Rhodospirillales bacterium]MDP6645880.1 branched-chain amino acid ABC transporter permease [Rhodospirillales bacterium]|tara:strand:- start:3913 stop:4926 length:1014 start_codon:yes stop_codon:yes gene_type:complete
MSAVQVERGTRASQLFSLVAVIVLLALVALPWWGGPGDMRLVAEMAYYLALAMLWNLLAGYAGLVSVGQQAFVGLGAYAFFYLTSSLGVHVYPAMAIAGPFAGLISIPVAFAVFRLRGHYFAIGTWVVAEIFALGSSLIEDLGAGSGMSLTPAIVRQVSASRDGRETIEYWMSLGICVIVFAVVYIILRSRRGLALTAIRDSEPASSSLGVNVFRTKLFIYVATATCTGLVGALIFLQKLRLSPEAGYSVNDWTVVVIFMVVVGGIGTIEGPIIGMLIYILLRELFADYGSLYLILMGAIAVLIMLKAPGGVWGLISERFGLQLFPLQRRLLPRNDE